MKLELDETQNRVSATSQDSERPKTPALLNYRRIAIAVGNGAPLLVSKTAMSLLRYRQDDIVAVIDATNAGRTAHDVYRLGGTIPIVASFSEVPEPDVVFIGIAPVGGVLPMPIRNVIVDAIEGGLDVVSGLHQFLIDDSDLVAAAKITGSRLIDLRRNQHRKTARGTLFRENCLRIHTVGHDCAVGKMVVTLEVERELKERGFDAKFLATGQTGIMISGSGVPVDCVVSDFVNGAVEELVQQHQSHDILLIEGQGSIVHPAFSAVTMGLLHGCSPQGLILCYELGRSTTMEYPHVPLRSLEDLRSLYETIGSIRTPTRVIGVAMNSRYVTAEEAEAEKERVQATLGLPVCDVYLDGAGALADAVLQLKQELFQ